MIIYDTIKNSFCIVLKYNEVTKGKSIGFYDKVVD